MAETSLSKIKISGISAAVPKKKLEREAYDKAFGREEVDKLIENIGIRERRSDPNLCTSDLCFAAAEKLIEELKWDKEAIDLLLFVSQTPDYTLPATSCILHGRLGLKNQCAAFDLNLGCSGYPYGLWTAASLMAAGGIRKCLLLVGETATRNISPLDRSTALIFGDAGTATALEFSEEAAPMYFSWGTDGKGWEAIIRRAGSHRLPHSNETATRTLKENGSYRADIDVYMSGTDVFSFTIREVPPLIRRTLELANWTMEDTDSFVFHQANQFMLQHLAKKTKIPKEKLPLSLAEFGNTSSASIPLTIVTSVPAIRERELKLMLLGFGVGLSWASAAVTTGPLVVPPLVEVDS